MRLVGLAAPLAGLAIALGGCAKAPNIGLSRPISSGSPAQAHESAARQDVAKGDLAGALGHAERAVEASPRDVGYRMLLGDLYLKNGRFRSAEAAFRDVLHLSPDNVRAAFSLALAEIAGGKRHSALARLEALTATAPGSDLGLAFALAGDTARAVSMLEVAARDPNAGARVRQNLALAYALAGDWQSSRLMAAQDLDPAAVPARMAEWASFAQPGSPAEQVAGMLGVRPADDPGQPVGLALAPNEPAFAAPEPVEVAQVDPPALPEPLVAVASTPAMEVPPTVTPARPPAPRPSAAPARFMVQLGAYASPQSLKQGWSQLRRRYALAPRPYGAAASVAGKGMVHRLSVGYPSQAEALRACRAIKSKGGGCFVRALSGDRPIEV